MANMNRIKFTINNQLYSVGSEVTATTTLNDFIRRVANLRGTKYMCQEGGCGACVVAVRTHTFDGEMRTFSVNSCLVSVLSCDGWDITTVEGIGNRQDGYNIIQKRLNNFFGSQCGYCSPGFVMSMYSLVQNKNKILTDAEIENSFGSNLCRCTGYRPILEAFRSLATDPEPHLMTKIADIEDLGEKKCSRTGIQCKGECKTDNNLDDWCVINDGDHKDKKIMLSDGKLWLAVNEIKSIFKILNDVGYDNYMLVAGNTSKGAYPIKFLPKVIIDINNISDLRNHYIDQNLVLGANMTLTATMELFKELSQSHEGFWYVQILYEHLDQVAHIPVRNIGTLAGNLVLKHEHPDFQSDVFLLLDCIGATLTLIDSKLRQTEVSLHQYMSTSVVGKIITNIKLPQLSKQNKLVTYKVAAKEQNAHAQVNGAFLYKFNENSTVEEASIVFGGINPKFSHAYKTEQYLIGRSLFQNEILQSALHCLMEELNADLNPPEPSPCFRQKVALGLFYKSIIKICPSDILNPVYESGSTIVERPPISHSYQEYDTDKKEFPITQPLLKREGLIQCAGEATYSDDEPKMPDEVFASFVLATVARADIVAIDASQALEYPGVIKVFTSADIPGTNTMTNIVPGFSEEYEELLASNKIRNFDQPVALVVAETQKIADEASYLVKIEYKNIRAPVVTIQDALRAPKEENRVRQSDSITPTAKGGNVTAVVKGTFFTPMQYHHMMELHTSVAHPVDDRIKIHHSTQFISSAQTTAAMVLNVSEWHTEVEAKRCGGAFGAKIFRSNFVSCATALVTKLLNRPCRMAMHLRDIMRATGKRPSSYLEYEVGVNDDGAIQYMNSNVYVNDGASHNENENAYVLTGFQNCYDTSRWKIQTYAVITDIPVNCFMRGPGDSTGMACIENIMDHIAFTVHKSPIEVRMANYQTENNVLPTLVPMILERIDYDERKNNVEIFNRQNRWKKRGMHFINMSFRTAYIGNYSALVSVYHGDGSVVIHTGGIELGQGIYTRIIQVAARELCVDVESVAIQPAINSASPNNIATASAITTECVAYSVIRACEQINERLAPVRADMPNATFKEIVNEADQRGILLQGVYLTSDKDPRLVNYNIFGVTVLELELDILTGRHWIVRADVYEDTGKSINPVLDVGQVEGAFVQGLGWWTVENLVYNEHTGELLTDRTWNYHILGAKDIPHDFRVYLRRKAINPVGILGSKAVGEPPLCMAFVIVGALRNAVMLSKRESLLKIEWINLDLPATNESIVKAAAADLKEFVLY